MNNLPENWTVFVDSEQLAQHTVARIVELAQAAIAERGEFHLVTAGGTTPTRCYQLLAELENQQLDKWFIYLGDERVLPAEDPERNSFALNQAWLSKVAIPASNIFFIQTELGQQESINLYRQVVEKVAKFDLVMLGMGEDGHTASLFPGKQTLASDALVLAETNSPKPPANRVSLGKKALENTGEMLKLITGASKQPIIQAWLSGEKLPINQVVAANTKVYISEDSL